MMSKLLRKLVFIRVIRSLNFLIKFILIFLNVLKYVILFLLFVY